MAMAAEPVVPARVSAVVSVVMRPPMGLVHTVHAIATKNLVLVPRTTTTGLAILEPMLLLHAQLLDAHVVATIGDVLDHVALERVRAAADRRAAPLRAERVLG